MGSKEGIMGSGEGAVGGAAESRSEQKYKAGANTNAIPSFYCENRGPREGEKGMTEYRRKDFVY